MANNTRRLLTEVPEEQKAKQLELIEKYKKLKENFGWNLPTARMASYIYELPRDIFSIFLKEKVSDKTLSRIELFIECETRKGEAKERKLYGEVE